MAMESVIMIVYMAMSAFVAFVLIREIIRTRHAQEAVLYCVILMPFVLRVLHIK